MVTILHCSDLHFDAKCHLKDPREIARQRERFKEIFASMINYAAENSVQIMLVSGDLFDEDYVARETVSLIHRELARLADCHVFISPGECDPYHSKSPYKQLKWPGNVHIFKSNDLERVELPELGVDIYGYAFMGKAQTICPFTNKRPIDKERLNIAIGHGDTTMLNSRACPISKSDIEFSGFDYIALGHLHDASGILHLGSSHFAYPGCLEGRNFDETGHKGAIFGTLDKANCDLKGVRFSKIRYVSADIDISECFNNEQLLEYIITETRNVGDDTALRVTLTGKTTLDIDISALESGIEGKHFIEVIDQTVLGHDLIALRQDKTIKGVFFRRMEEKLLNSNETQKIQILKAMQAGLNELDPGGK